MTTAHVQMLLLSVEPVPSLTSHEFLGPLFTPKPGHCPSWGKVAGFAAACVQCCKGDVQCPGKKKCCSNQCGYTWQPQKTCTQVK
uniref:WAP domain-containing protein n=1 Tax=Strix occidentalis caurina TaxID=311401 RepID=A0A8D0ELN1_STROC